jgi:tRNA (mo5U34)-methyltransferase
MGGINNRQIKMKHTQKISKIHWYHSIELEPGLITPGNVSLSYLNRMVADLALPQDMSNLTVLDVGARDGFFSFEAEKRGAHVIAVDIQPIDNIGLNVAKEILNSKVEFLQSNVYDLTLEKIGGKPVDVIFFLGLMYHLRHPLLAIDNLWKLLKPNGIIYLETAYLDEYFIANDNVFTSLDNINPILSQTALLQYYRNDELNPGDFSNWFSPNRKALENILYSAGFEPQLLSKWENRILYKATKLEGIPEYKLSEHGADPLLSRWAQLNPKDIETRRANRHFEPLVVDSNQKARIVLDELRKSKLYKLLRFLGFWSFISKKIEDISVDHH